MSLKADGILGQSPAQVAEGQRRFLTRVKDLLRPAIFTPSTGPKKLRETAYLDGLRGFAAFLVVTHHHTLWIHSGNVMQQGIGYNDKWYLATAPFLRIFITGGHFAVSIFFVISGYVLSVKPLTFVHNGEQAKLADNVGSALFRRWLRLFLPVIAVTLINITLWHIFQVDSGGNPFHPKRHEYFKDELWSWYSEFKNYSYVFKDGGMPWFTYNGHSWSMPVEMRGSVIIYTTLLALSRCTKNVRLTIICLLMFYFIYITDAYYGTLFMGGMLFADLDLLAKKDEHPRWLKRLENYKELIFLNLFVVAMYLGGSPSNDVHVETIRATPGWYWLSFLKPQAVYDPKWAYLVPASLITIPAVKHLSLLKNFMETDFCQYLGRIAFSLYLVHGPILWDIGDRVYVAMGWQRSEAYFTLEIWPNDHAWATIGIYGFELGFLIPLFFLVIFTLWVAEIITKLVDVPSINFTQWLFKKSLAPVDEFEKASLEVLNGSKHLA